MNIYLDSGYLDISKIRSTGCPFILIVSGRGIGKTYGVLERQIIEREKTIYMRRTQTQVDIIATPEYSPFKELNIDHHWNIQIKSTAKNLFSYYDIDKNNELLGHICALSTFKNLRGFSASDIELLFYDEFIAEKHEHPIKCEADAFFNAYETINRNRELKGLKPLQAMCASNSNDLANPIFMELGIVNRAEKMIKNNSEFWIDKERGICLVMPCHSPISKRKTDTALYRLTKGLAFSKMSLNNEFSSEEIGRIASRPLAEYKPVVSVGEICVYQHKSNRTYYVSTHKTGSPPQYGTGETERARFRRAYCWLWDEYLCNNIEFEQYLCEILLTKAFE